MVDARPFHRLDDLFKLARNAAFPFTPAEFEAALAGYPAPPAASSSRLTDSPADVRVRRQLQDGVKTYERKFGRPFLVGTNGGLPAETLVELWTRLGNDVDTEDRVLAQQLREISLLRLADIITN